MVLISRVSYGHPRLQFFVKKFPKRKIKYNHISVITVIPMTFVKDIMSFLQKQIKVYGC